MATTPQFIRLLPSDRTIQVPGVPTRSSRRYESCKCREEVEIKKGSVAGVGVCGPSRRSDEKWKRPAATIII